MMYRKNNTNTIQALSLGLLGLVLGFCCFGCSFYSPEPYGIRFDKETYDFGVVYEGEEVKYTYQFRNTGRNVLAILNVQPTCGCTVAGDWDKTVASGKKGKIPVTFKTPRMTGEVNKVINIKTNVPEKETIQLFLKGKVIIPIDVVPFNTWLGEVTKETRELSGSFEITNNLGGPLKILAITPPDEQTKYSFTVLEENHKFRLDYTKSAPFDGSETVGKEFKLKTDNKKHEYINPRFYYHIPLPLKVYPEKLFVEPERLARNNTFDIDIKSSMDVPIAILDLKLQAGKGITCVQKTNVEGKYYQFTVKIPPDYVFTGNEKMSVSFRVKNDPAKKLYMIPIELVATVTVAAQ